MKPGPLIDITKRRLEFSKEKYMDQLVIMEDSNEIYQLFGEPDIIRQIKSKRVKRLGHLFIANEYHSCRMLTFATLYGTRRVGQPPIRWLESIKEDLRNIGVGIWKRMAMGRDKWKIITEAVKVGTQL
jgi:hypothetical protein